MKIFIQFISGIFGSILLGIAGLGLGTFIGGNYGFPDFGGNAGYEAGGSFLAIIGISLGALVGICITRRLQKQRSKPMNALVAMIIGLAFGLIAFDYNMTKLVQWMIFLLPALLIVGATNFDKKNSGTSQLK